MISKLMMLSDINRIIFLIKILNRFNILFSAISSPLPVRSAPELRSAVR